MIQVVQRSHPQNGEKTATPLRLVNAEGEVLSTHIITNQFSDIDPMHSQLQSNDPRMLIALMTKTRHECRSTGLIPRDTIELIHIGRTLGIAPINTKKIIRLVQSGDFSQITEIPVGDKAIKKTRMDVRVLIALLIWSLTIVVAMSMV
jgi:hypothetical protein